MPFTVLQCVNKEIIILMLKLHVNKQVLLVVILIVKVKLK